MTLPESVCNNGSVLQVPAPVDIGQKYGLLFSSYDYRIVFPYNIMGLFGRGTLFTAPNIRTFKEKFPGNIGITLGRMTQLADGALILTGGEHSTDAVANITFYAMHHFRHVLEKKNIDIDTETKGPVRIGSAVVIGTNAIVLSGVTIGDGAIIGAGAVVTKDVPPFAIVAGNPARIIRYRYSDAVIQKLLEIRWWDFEFDYLCENLGEMKNLSGEKMIEHFSNATHHAYAPTHFRIVFSFFKNDVSTNYQCVGYDYNNQFVPLGSNPVFDAYVAQKNLSKDSCMYLVKDIYNYF